MYIWIFIIDQSFFLNAVYMNDIKDIIFITINFLIMTTFQITNKHLYIEIIIYFYNKLIHKILYYLLGKSKFLTNLKEKIFKILYRIYEYSKRLF
jgi:hypothetical protein